MILDSVDAGIGFMDNAMTVEDLRGAPVPEPVRIINNTLAGNHYALSDGANVVAIHNLFVDSAGHGVFNTGGNSVLAFNLFWNNAIDHESANLDAGSTIYADPMLGIDQELGDGSPAIDAGTS